MNKTDQLMIAKEIITESLIGKEMVAGSMIGTDSGNGVGTNSGNGAITITLYLLHTDMPMLNVS